MFKLIDLSRDHRLFGCSSLEREVFFPSHFARDCCHDPYFRVFELQYNHCVYTNGFV